MKKEVKVSEWAEALRSDEFNQATEKLKRGDAYCCLGVLCKLGEAEFNQNGSVCFKYPDGESGHSNASILGATSVSLEAALVDFEPLTLRDSWKISRLGTLPIYVLGPGPDGRKVGGVQFVLSLLNDEGFTFSEIADVIEHILDPNAVITVETNDGLGSH